MPKEHLLIDEIFGKKYEESPVSVDYVGIYNQPHIEPFHSGQL